MCRRSVALLIFLRSPPTSSERRQTQPQVPTNSESNSISFLKPTPSPLPAPHGTIEVEIGAGPNQMTWEAEAGEDGSSSPSCSQMPLKAAKLGFAAKEVVVMKRLGIVILLSGIAATCSAAAPEKTLKEKLQGRWGRPNFEWMDIKGDQLELTEQNKPFNPFRRGALKFDEKRGVAEANCNDGATMWIWYCGESPTGEETSCYEVIFPDGRVWEKGCVMHKPK